MLPGQPASRLTRRRVPSALRADQTFRMALFPALMILGMMMLAALCCSALSDGAWLFVLLLLGAGALRIVFLLWATVRRSGPFWVITPDVQKAQLLRRK